MVTEEKKQLVTSLRIDPKLWKEAKIRAIKDNMTLQELVENAIRDWINRRGVSS